LSDGDEVVGVRPAGERAMITVATAASYVLQCRAGDVNLLANPGKGVTVIKVGDGDRVLGFAVDEKLTLETEKGKTLEIEPAKREATGRGGKGRAASKRDPFA